MVDAGESSWTLVAASPSPVADLPQARLMSNPPTSELLAPSRRAIEGSETAEVVSKIRGVRLPADLGGQGCSPQASTVKAGARRREACAWTSNRILQHLHMVHRIVGRLAYPMRLAELEVVSLSVAILPSPSGAPPPPPSD